MKKLSNDFYQREDVVLIAKELLGKVLVTNFNNEITAGIITETEAYNGAVDKASHAYNNRRTNRTEIMFGIGGNAYVYLCYGIHHLFNVVTSKNEIPHAVLIRAVQPYKGNNIMLNRLNRKVLPANIAGPGLVSKALGINTIHSGMSLKSKELYIADEGIIFPENAIKSTPRIGVDYAGEDALLPYRFVVETVNFKRGQYA